MCMCVCVNDEYVYTIYYIPSFNLHTKLEFLKKMKRLPYLWEKHLNVLQSFTLRDNIYGQPSIWRRR